MTGKLRWSNISEFGIKIKNIEASTLVEYNVGLRDHYEFKDALFVNSLFKDFLEKNGLSVRKDGSTRDIICLEFNYGTRSYEDECNHLTKILKDTTVKLNCAKSNGDEHLIKRYTNQLNKIERLVTDVRKNQFVYSKIDKASLRTKIYNEGVSIQYVDKTSDGKIKHDETIHYKMLYRSTGKAKKGSCVFICDRLYDISVDFLRMGIILPDKNPMIVEMSAYSPLVSSGIVGRVKINPKNILILKDVDRFFTTNIVSIETDENKCCVAKKIEGYNLKNTLFDGQALIDSSIFPDWGSGFILLRHHFCKMAAFNTNIQEFFKDYFGDRYLNATVTDMFGNVHYVKDIELITTDNAMKWLKFKVSYDYWCEKVFENDCMFGIVKTAHPSKLGSNQKMSYQMVNSLSNEIMPDVVKKSVEYIEHLKCDNDFFLEYLKNNANFSNDFEVLYTLCHHNKNFIYSSYYRDRKKYIIKNLLLKIKSGELIQNAENLTVVGSPYAMLLYATSNNEDDVDLDDTFSVEPDAIQCYTKRFDNDAHIAFFRSPFNSKNNLIHLHNVYNEKFEKYFNFSEQIVAMNMIGTDAQDRANGMDQDSDFGYATTEEHIVTHARMCYLNYPTIVNNIPKESNHYSNTLDDFAKVDNNLAKSQLAIGESSNLAQLAQTYSYNFSDSRYNDYVCILSVLAQVAIDNAKRTFDIDLTNEIRRIKKDMNIQENGYPKFWAIIKREFNKEKINPDLVCPMNYLANLSVNYYRDSNRTIDMSEFIVYYKPDNNRRRCQKVENMIQSFSLRMNIGSDWSQDDVFLLRSDFDELINEMRQISLSGTYLSLMSWLLNRAFQISKQTHNTKRMVSKLHKNKVALLNILYNSNPNLFLKCFRGEK